jgi:hypothetical protein
LRRTEYKKIKGEGMVSAIAGHGHACRIATSVPRMSYPQYPQRGTIIPGIPCLSSDHIHLAAAWLCGGDRARVHGEFRYPM